MTNRPEPTRISATADVAATVGRLDDGRAGWVYLAGNERATLPVGGGALCVPLALEGAGVSERITWERIAAQERMPMRPVGSWPAPLLARCEETLPCS